MAKTARTSIPLTARPHRTHISHAVGACWDSESKKNLRPIICGAVLSVALGASAAADAATFVVTNSNNSGPGSFRQTVRDANRSPGPDEVVFSGVSGTIDLRFNPVYIRGSLDIEGPVTMDRALLRIQAGSRADINLRKLTLTRSTVDAYYADSLSIEDSTISGSDSTGVKIRYVSDIEILRTAITGHADHGISHDYYTDSLRFDIVDSNISNNGAHGIANAGRYTGGQTIKNSVISGNGGYGICCSGRGKSGVSLDNTVVSDNEGCGVDAYSASIVDSQITGNAACGVDASYYYYPYNFYVARLTMQGSTVSDNGSIGVVAGVAEVFDSTIANNQAVMCAGLLARSSRIVDSTISGNTATDGEGGGLCLRDGDRVYRPGNHAISNSTIAKNSATSGGGGVHALGFSHVWIEHSTITGNRAVQGGGLRKEVTAAGDDSVVMKNTIVAGNHGTTDPDISAPIPFDLEYSLIKEPDTAQINELIPGSNILGQAALLDVFQDNGGPTRTHSLKPGSPARDAGDPALVPPPDFDQRGLGYPRVVNGRIDMGAVEVQGDAEIGDLVWQDDNGNGLQDAGEAGKPDVTVRLRDCNGNVLVTTKTRANGQYRFKGLAPGRYQVEFVAPSGFMLSPQSQGSRAGKDSNPDPATGLTACRFLPANRVRLGIDAGLVPQPAGTAALGDRMWEDLDGDGVQDAGEPGLGGVTVRLLDCDGNELTRGTSGPSGAYRFDGLAAGGYRIGVSPPLGFRLSPARQGSKRGQDSDPDPDSGQTSCIPMSEGKVRLGIDAGFVPQPTGSGEIGDFVWRDSDGDGHQDNNESGLSGVQVRLLNCNGMELSTTTTNTNGQYLFGNLPAASYRVAFLAPAGLDFSPPGQSSGGKDSDPDQNTGVTACKRLTDAQSRLGIDAGLN